MVALACNYSTALADLLAQGQVELDCVMLSRPEAFRQELAPARALRPVLLQMLPSGLGHIDAPACSWLELNRTLHACGAPHASLQVTLSSADWGNPDSPERAIANIIRGVTGIAAQVALPLLLENMAFHAGDRGVLRCAAEPEALLQICHRSGAEFLLDLAHARVSAWHMKRSIYSYLAALPLNKVREIHISGAAQTETPLSFETGPHTRSLSAGPGLWDSHTELEAVDYALLRWALEKTDAQLVTLEYGGSGAWYEGRTDPQALVRQLTRLREWCTGWGRS